MKVSTSVRWCLAKSARGLNERGRKEPAKALGLEKWLSILSRSFAEHILPVDRAVVAEWGRMSAKRPVSTVDALLAATAKVHGMTLATRNTSHVTDLGANVFNPFEAAK